MVGSARSLSVGQYGQQDPKPKGEVKIGIVGKYTDWRDSYKSLSEALIHGGVANDVRVNMQYIDAESLEKEGPKNSEKGGAFDLLKAVDGILVPGGFGERGIEGKIQAIQYARTNKIPFFGICLGMQLAVIEFARNICQMKDASSTEFKPEGKENVISIMDSQKALTDKGGTMRLGAYSCQILPQAGESRTPTKAFEAYGKEVVSERHRHRFEVSNSFRGRLEEKGLLVSGKNINRETHLELVEMVELPNHPWFLGCQFHPEFLSRPLQPHPLFNAFIKASKSSKESSKRS